MLRVLYASLDTVKCRAYTQYYSFERKSILAYNNNGDTRIGLWKTSTSTPQQPVFSGTDKETGEGYLLFVNLEKKNPKGPDMTIIRKPADPNSSYSSQQGSGQPQGGGGGLSDIPF